MSKYPNMLEYIATIRVAVNTDLPQSVEDQLDAVILPSGDEVDWTLDGLTPLVLTEPEPNAAVAAIAYALDGENHEWDQGNQLRFLELWNEGSFQELRDNWDNIPDEVFIGADSQFKPE